MSITKDLSASDSVEKNPIFLDRDFAVYEIQPEGESLVYVEKLAIKKDQYEPLPLGSPTINLARGRLIKEDSFTDIGGGYMAFHRHFAVRPKPWFTYEPKEVQLYTTNSRTTNGINYDYFYGTEPVGFGEGGFRRNFTFNAKASRYYITAYELLIYYIASDFAPLGWTNGKGSLYPNGLIDNGDGGFIDLIDSDTGETISVPKALFVNEPRAKTSTSGNPEVVVAPDRIKRWYGDYYEITRYTSSISTPLPSNNAIVALTAFFNVGNSFDAGEQSYIEQLANGVQQYNPEFVLWNLETNEAIGNSQDIYYNEVRASFATIDGDARLSEIGIAFQFPSTLPDGTELEINSVNVTGTKETVFADTYFADQGDTKIIRVNWNQLTNGISVRLNLKKKGT
jgi:hypothetical protein